MRSLCQDHCNKILICPCRIVPNQECEECNPLAGRLGKMIHDMTLEAMNPMQEANHKFAPSAVLFYLKKIRGDKDL